MVSVVGSLLLLRSVAGACQQAPPTRRVTSTFGFEGARRVILRPFVRNTIWPFFFILKRPFLRPPANVPFLSRKRKLLPFFFQFFAAIVVQKSWPDSSDDLERRVLARRIERRRGRAER